MHVEPPGLYRFHPEDAEAPAQPTREQIESVARTLDATALLHEGWARQYPSEAPHHLRCAARDRAVAAWMRAMAEH
jgi:hypothetical protein